MLTWARRKCRSTTYVHETGSAALDFTVLPIACWVIGGNMTATHKKLAVEFFTESEAFLKQADKIFSQVMNPSALGSLQRAR